jgi:hypothetical protein
VDTSAGLKSSDQVTPIYTLYRYHAPFTATSLQPNSAPAGCSCASAFVPCRLTTAAARIALPAPAV